MDIKTPDLGVEKAEVTEILVKVGDQIDKDQSLVLVESAKASVEVPSPVAGVIEAVLIEQGQTISEHVPLFRVKTSDEDDATSSDQNSPAATPADQAEPKTDDSTSKDQAAQPSSKPQPSTSSDSSSESKDSSDQSFNVPDLGVDEAEVSEVLVKVGDTVKKDQSIALVESSKASVEIPSPADGVVQSLAITVGQTIHSGDALVVIAITENATTEKSTQAKDSQKLSTSAGDNPVSVDKSDDSVDKKPASVDKKPSDGQKQPISVDNSAQASHATSQATASTAAKTATDIGDMSDVYAGPAVRQVARQLGVDLHQVTGTGPHQRLLKEDVFAYVKTRLGTPSSPSAATPAPAASGLPKLPDLSKWGANHSEPLTRLQQAAIPQLALNMWMPQVTQFDQADITELESLRESLKAGYKKDGISLTILAFIAKAVAHLLLQEPRFNSHLADDGKSLIIRDEVHLGIAVATPDGLIVPVFRTPEQKGIRQIAQELQILGQKARDKKLGPNDLAGASFTISSLGNLGGTGFTPLVSWPQVAILGISPAAMQPVWDGQAFVPRLMLPLSLSYDHRVINGADAARFARRLAELLADLRQVLL